MRSVVPFLVFTLGMATVCGCSTSMAIAPERPAIKDMQLLFGWSAPYISEGDGSSPANSAVVRDVSVYAALLHFEDAWVQQKYSGASVVECISTNSGAKQIRQLRVRDEMSRDHDLYLDVTSCVGLPLFGRWEFRSSSRTESEAGGIASYSHTNGFLSANVCDWKNFLGERSGTIVAQIEEPSLGVYVLIRGRLAGGLADGRWVSVERNGVLFLADFSEGILNGKTIRWGHDQEPVVQLVWDDGEVKEMWKWSNSGSLLSWMEMRGHAPHGQGRLWHSNGNLKCTMEFKDGKRHGVAKWWDKSGEPEAEGVFIKGKPWTGTFILEDEGTQIIVPYKKGIPTKKTTF